MPPEAQYLQRLANQRLETELLLGVDFLPIASENSEPSRAAITENSDDVAKIEDKKAALQQLATRAAATFPICDSLSGATQPVFGEGNPDAMLMFIGGAPGDEEDRAGRPCVGEAGKKLDQMITALGLERTDVYITNILNARPPKDRTPTSEEIKASTPFLIDQIRIIMPDVIISLGEPATRLLMDSSDTLTHLRGRWSSFTDGTLHIPVMPTFHPAYVLGNYTKETRLQVWTDLQKVMELLGLSVGDK